LYLPSFLYLVSDYYNNNVTITHRAWDAAIGIATPDCNAAYELWSPQIIASPAASPAAAALPQFPKILARPTTGS
jgi:hypothetical protein